MSLLTRSSSWQECLDLLGFGDNSAAALTRVFREVCGVEVSSDGSEWETSAIRIVEIREDQEYQGHRVHLLARLGPARIELHVDIGIGDVVVPRPQEIIYPTLLDLPAPHLQAYSRESVVAEKVHAMVLLGITNSRMKDFYDLWVMARDFEFDGEILARAIKATFERRSTPMPAGVPLALSDDFADDPTKQIQWQALMRRSVPTTSGLQLMEVMKRSSG